MPELLASWRIDSCAFRNNPVASRGKLCTCRRQVAEGKGLPIHLRLYLDAVHCGGPSADHAASLESPAERRLQRLWNRNNEICWRKMSLLSFECTQMLGSSYSQIGRCPYLPQRTNRE